MAEEKKIQRLGEWMDTHWGQYAQYVDVLVPTGASSLITASGDGFTLNLQRRNLAFIDAYSLVRLIKDYDKYLDDNLVL